MKHSSLRDALKGILVTTVTPYRRDRSVDEEGIRINVRFLVEKGVNVITPCGSIGEWSSLTDEELEKVVAITVDEVNGKVPVLAGASSTSSKQAAQRARRAEDVGADGILILPPFYLRYQIEGLVRHFEMVAESTGLALVLYNSPDFLGFELPTNELSYILERVPSIVAIKDSTTDMLEFAYRLNVLGDRAAVLLGNEPYCYYGLYAGSLGTFTSLANFSPLTMLQLYENIRAGDLDKARRIYLSLVPYFAFRRRTKNPIAVVKQAMVYAGIKINPFVRPPLVELAENEKLELKNIVEDLLQRTDHL